MDVAWLKRQRTRLFDDRFATFHSVRRDEWRPTVQRKKPINLAPDLARYWADWQSPMLELDRVTRTTILMLDQTKMDFVAWNDADDYKRAVEHVRLWSMISQIKQNEGRWRDAYIAEGQMMDGAAIIRKHWMMPKEPSPPARYADEDDADYTLRSMSERDRYYASMDNWPFWEHGVDSLQCAWDGRDMEKPDIFMQESEVPYYEMQDSLELPEGKRWSLDEAGKVVILGPEMDVIEPTDAGGRKFKLLVCDYKDPKTGRFKCCEYLYPSGRWDDGEVVREYDNPLGRCSYFVIPAAEIDRHQTDPHLRYRPMMYPLITAVYAYNWIMSMIAALSARALSDERIYVDASKVPEGLRPQLEGLSATVEGQGAESRLTFARPEAGVDQYIVLPGEVKAFPNNIIEGLQVMLQEQKEQIAEFRSNRFQSGNVPDNVVASTTASTFSAVSQASSLPFGGELVMSDAFIEEDVKAEHNAIKVWDDGAKVDKPYYGVSPRKIQFLGGDSGLGGQASAGDRVRVSATMLREHKFDINIQTANKSRQERDMETQGAFFEFDHGTMDDLQLYRRLGYDDAVAQRETMAKFYSRTTQAMRYEAFWGQQQDKFFEAVVGLSPSMAGALQPQQGGASGNGQAPSANPTANMGVGPPAIQSPTGGNQGIGGGMT